MRLKQKLPGANSLHSKRLYDRAQTPFDRLCDKGVLPLPPDQVRHLQALRKATNPCQLRRSIESLTSQVFALPSARAGVTEDVRQTLGLWQPGQLPRTSDFASHKP
jgi:hypothetical protein